MFKFHFLLLSFFVLGSFFLSQGANYFISPSGMDNANRAGSQSEPWRNILFSLEQAAGGDTIFALDGEYDQLVTGSTLQPFSSMVTVRAVNLHQASIREVGGNCVMFLDGPANIAIEGFVMDGKNSSSSSNVCHVNGGDYVFVKDNIITHGPQGYSSDALKINAGSHHILVEGNIIFDGNDEQIDILSFPQNGEGWAQDIVIRRNVVYKDKVGTDRASASSKMGSRRIIYDSNVFGRMNSQSSNGALRFGGGEQPGHETEVCIAINNAFFNTYGRKGAFSLGGSKKTLFANNVIYDHGGSWCYIAIFSNYSTSIANDDFTIVNNILYSSSPTMPGEVYKLWQTSPNGKWIDYNLYYNGGGVCSHRRVSQSEYRAQCCF